MRVLKCVVALGVMPVVAACGGTDYGSPGVSGAVSQTITLKRMNLDDSSIRTFTVTRKQMEELVAEKRAWDDQVSTATADTSSTQSSDGIGVAREAIVSSDGGCAASDLWLYTDANDDPNQPELCMTGTGSGYLSFFAGTIRKYWPGTQPGRFPVTYGGRQSPNCESTAGQFAANSGIVTADSDVASASFVQLGRTFVCPQIFTSGSPGTGKVYAWGFDFTPNTTSTLTVTATNGTTHQIAATVASDGDVTWAPISAGCVGTYFTFAASARDQTDMATPGFVATTPVSSGCNHI